jgi:hypothetical protein
MRKPLHTVACDSRLGRSSGAAADQPIANQHHPQGKRQCQPDFIGGTQQQNHDQRVTQNRYPAWRDPGLDQDRGRSCHEHGRCPGSVNCANNKNLLARQVVRAGGYQRVWLDRQKRRHRVRSCTAQKHHGNIQQTTTQVDCGEELP